MLRDSSKCVSNGRIHLQVCLKARSSNWILGEYMTGEGVEEIRGGGREGGEEGRGGGSGRKEGGKGECELILKSESSGEGDKLPRSACSEAKHLGS